MLRPRLKTIKAVIWKMIVPSPRNADGHWGMDVPRTHFYHFPN